MVSKPKGNQVQVMGYYSPEAAKRLRRLSDATHVPQAALLREALEDLLRKRSAPSKNPRSIGGGAGENLGQAFSAIELLVAADVINAAVSENRRHLDRDALKRVQAKLAMAYKWKSRAAADH